MTDACCRASPPRISRISALQVGHRRRLLDAIAALAAEPAVADVPVGPAAERRQLTVMFCDLVGSTTPAIRFDPEDLREIEPAHRRIAGADPLR